MKISKVMLWAFLSMAFLLTSCRSRQEAAGDKYRKGGDPLNALNQYEEALKRGKLSKEFYKNYTQVNIQAMALRSKEDPMAEFLDILKDTVLSLLRQYPDPQNEALFAQALQDIGMKRINLKTPEAEESGFKFLEAANGLAAKPGNFSTQVGALRNDFLSKKMKEIEDDYKEAASEPTAGIVADYKMNKLLLMFGSELPEMKPLWSKIRKTNLNTYLMYDLEGLLPELDARINKYGILLAIVNLKQDAKSLKVQLKAFNGSSGPIHFDGDNFTMVDRKGNVYNPTAKIGHFSTKDMVGVRDESKTGGLTFTYPAGTEPHYIEFKSTSGVTRKYLP